MLETKKVKEIKDYAKGDVKYFIREKSRYEEESKSGFTSGLVNFKKYYPKGITSYYEKMIDQHEERRERLITQFGYTKETLVERAEIYHEAFWSSWRWWEKKLLENETVMAKYSKLFKQAEEVAEKVDVSDIPDGFPCGMAVIYLKPEAKDTDLGKVLRSRYDGDSYSAKVCHWSAYKLPVKMPSRRSQCMTIDERICGKVADFLTENGIPTAVYSMID